MISINLKNRIYTSLVLFSLIILIFNSNFILVYSLIIFGVFSILEFITIIKRIFINKFYLCISIFSFMTFTFIFCFVFFFFSNLLQLKIILFSLLLCCIASDLGGFIFGKTFNGPKLTKISPNKTIVGSLGSIFLASLVMSISIFFFTKNYSYTILIIAIITSIACQFGDLFFSLLKRKAKLKDTGNFLPGHGGVLDRLDGIFFGVPCGFISLVFLY
jgi:phosphatidate cytidylyltransferase